MNSKVRTGRATRVLATAAMLALLVASLMAGSVFAAKGGQGKPGGGGGGGGGGSLTLAMVTDQNANGLPNWGDQIRFNVSTTNAYPVVSVTCSQGGNVVYGDSRPYYWPNIWDDPGIFTLSSLAWSSGAADCTAVLKGTSNGKVVTLGSMSFHVDA